MNWCGMKHVQNVLLPNWQLYYFIEYKTKLNEFLLCFVGYYTWPLRFCWKIGPGNSESTAELDSVSEKQDGSRNPGFL